MSKQRTRSGPRWPKVVLATTLLGPAGCTDPLGEPPIVEEAEGQLGAGTFRWLCVDQTDTTCGTGVFPTQVAVGARFDLDFTPGHSVPVRGPLAYVPASIERVDRSGPATREEFLVQAVGAFSVLVIADGYGVDFVPLRAEAIDGIRLDRVDGPSSDFDPGRDCTPTLCGEVPAGIEVAVWIPQGHNIRFEALATHEGRTLAGAVTRDWGVFDASALSLSNEQGARASVRGLEVGVSPLRLVAGGFEHVAYVGVYDAPVSDDDDDGSSSGDTTGGSDTGGDSTGTSTTTGDDSSGGSDEDSGSGGSSGSESGGGESSGSDSGGSDSGGSDSGGSEGGSR